MGIPDFLLDENEKAGTSETRSIIKENKIECQYQLTKRPNAFSPLI
jgi:hypothetical protein